MFLHPLRTQPEIIGDQAAETAKRHSGEDHDRRRILQWRDIDQLFAGANGVKAALLHRGGRQQGGNEKQADAVEQTFALHIGNSFVDKMASG